MSSTHGCVYSRTVLAASLHGEASGCVPCGSVLPELLGRPSDPGASRLMLQGSAVLGREERPHPSHFSETQALLTQQQVFQRSALRSHRDQESKATSAGIHLVAQDGCLGANH